MKRLSNRGFAGLFLVAFAPAAFAETEQLQSQQQQQIQQQQRQQIHSREHMPSDQGLQRREQTRTLTEEQERLRQQQQMQQHQQMQERAQQKGMMQQGGQGMGPHGGRHGWWSRPLENSSSLFLSRQVTARCCLNQVGEGACALGSLKAAYAKIAIDAELFDIEAGFEPDNRGQ